jgi:hypothetical protein
MRRVAHQLSKREMGVNDMAIPIYVYPRTPGATDTTEWTTFCHKHKTFILIRHCPTRNTSRWNHVERKRKFCVIQYFSGHVGLQESMVSYHLTLEHARRAAAKLAKEN